MTPEIKAEWKGSVNWPNQFWVASVDTRSILIGIQGRGNHVPQIIKLMFLSFILIFFWWMLKDFSESGKEESIKILGDAEQANIRSRVGLE